MVPNSRSDRWRGAVDAPTLLAEQGEAVEDCPAPWLAVPGAIDNTTYSKS
jgi:hypothetical protein